MPSAMNTQSMSVGTIGATDISCSNMTIAGDLVVLGSNVNLDVQTVLIEDNILLVNKNQTGVPSSLLKSGIEVERGDAPNYQFVFEEQSQLFKVGLSNNLQAVATRPDVITDGAVGYWNASNTQLAFNSNVRIDSSGLAASTVNAQKVNVSGDIYFSGTLYQNGAPFSSGISSTNLTVDASDALTVSVNSNVSVLVNSGKTITNSEGGNVHWATVQDGIGGDSGKGVAADAYGNVYIAGKYDSGGLKLYDSLGAAIITMRTPTYANCMFLAKYNASGTPVWAASIDGVKNDYQNCVAVHSDGSVVVVGSYSANCNVYAGAANASSTLAFSLRTPTYDAGFLVKFSASGVPMWGACVDGGSTDSITSVAVDTTGNIAVVGYYSSSNSVVYNGSGATAFSLHSITNTNYGTFVLKYTSLGVPLWAGYIDGPSHDVGMGIATDLQGNIIATGYYSSSNVWIYDGSGGQALRLRDSIYSTYIAKFSPLGVPMWVSYVDNDSAGNQVTCDLSGNVIVTGYYTNASPCNVYNGSGLSVFTLLGTATSTLFVVKYTSVGIPVWAGSVAGGTGTTNCYSVTSDAIGNVYIGGNYTSNAVAYTGSGTVGFSLRTSNGSSAMVVKYNPLGIPLWAGYVDGISYEYGLSVSANPSGNVFFSGYYGSSGAMVLDGSGNTVTNLRNPDLSASFLVNYNTGGSIITIPPYSLPSSLTPSSNGFQKILYNKSSNNYTCTVNIRNSTDTVTLSTLTIGAGSNQKLVWIQDAWLSL